MCHRESVRWGNEHFKRSTTTAPRFCQTILIFLHIAIQILNLSPSDCRRPYLRSSHELLSTTFRHIADYSFPLRTIIHGVIKLRTCVARVLTYTRLCLLVKISETNGRHPSQCMIRMLVLPWLVESELLGASENLKSMPSQGARSPPLAGGLSITLLLLSAMALPGCCFPE